MAELIRERGLMNLSIFCTIALFVSLRKPWLYFASAAKNVRLAKLFPWIRGNSLMSGNKLLTFPDLVKSVIVATDTISPHFD